MIGSPSLPCSSRLDEPAAELAPGAEDAQTSTQAAGPSSLLAGASGRFYGRCGGLRPGLGQVIASVFSMPMKSSNNASGEHSPWTYGPFAGSHLVRVSRLFVHSGVRVKSIVNIDTRLSCMPMLKPLGLLCAACANTSFIHSNRHVDISK